MRGWGSRHLHVENTCNKNLYNQHDFLLQLLMHIQLENKVMKSWKCGCYLQCEFPDTLIFPDESQHEEFIDSNFWVRMKWYWIMHYLLIYWELSMKKSALMEMKLVTCDRRIPFPLADWGYHEYLFINLTVIYSLLLLTKYLTLVLNKFESLNLHLLQLFVLPGAFWSASRWIGPRNEPHSS